MQKISKFIQTYRIGCIAILSVICLSPMGAKAALQCAQFLKLTSCGVDHTNVYGDTSAASRFTNTCYDRYEAGGDYKLINGDKYITSVTCKDGYKAKAYTREVCINNINNRETITYYHCECTTTTTWGSWMKEYSSNGSPAGYDRQIGTKNSCGTTSSVYKYRCSPGYYSAAGLSTADTASELQCTSCVDECGAGHTSPAGSTSSSACKASASTVYYDSRGSFTYGAKCCCGVTCDSLCNSGQSCDANADCESGKCTNGCCQANVSSCTNGSCSRDADCPSLYPTCSNGCCTVSFPTFCKNGTCSKAADCPTAYPTCSNGCCVASFIPSCAVGHVDYCVTDADCRTVGAGMHQLEICNTATNCCEDLAFKEETIK